MISIHSVSGIVFGFGPFFPPVFDTPTKEQSRAHQSRAEHSTSEQSRAAEVELSVQTNQSHAAVESEKEIRPCLMQGWQRKNASRRQWNSNPPQGDPRHFPPLPQLSLPSTQWFKHNNGSDNPGCVRVELLACPDKLDCISTQQCKQAGPGGHRICALCLLCSFASWLGSYRQRILSRPEHHLTRRIFAASTATNEAKQNKNQNEAKRMNKNEAGSLFLVLIKVPPIED